MARMYPQYGPVKETTSAAERRLYESLRSSLPDEYRVYHGVTWHTKQEGRPAADGEIDKIGL